MWMSTPSFWLVLSAVALMVSARPTEKTEDESDDHGLDKRCQPSCDPNKCNINGATCTGTKDAFECQCAITMTGYRYDCRPHCAVTAMVHFLTVQDKKYTAVFYKDSRKIWIIDFQTTESKFVKEYEVNDFFKDANTQITKVDAALSVQKLGDGKYNERNVILFIGSKMNVFECGAELEEGCAFKREADISDEFKEAPSVIMAAYRDHADIHLLGDTELAEYKIDDYDPITDDSAHTKEADPIPPSIDQIQPGFPTPLDAIIDDGTSKYAVNGATVHFSNTNQYMSGPCKDGPEGFDNVFIDELDKEHVTYTV